MIEGVIAAVVGVALVLGAFVLFKRQVGGSIGAERNALLGEIPKTIAQLETLLAKGDNFASRLQLESLQKMTQSTVDELGKEKSLLKETEGRLDQAQKEVENKESHHQEMKTAKEEDEQKLQELLERFGQVSSESMELEQHLAASMKNLDKLLDEAELTADQSSVLRELSTAMTNASSRLRDLLVEYTTVKERLELLSQQHRDLEEEYTRLVEQQLGE